MCAAVRARGVYAYILSAAGARHAWTSAHLLGQTPYTPTSARTARFARP